MFVVSGVNISSYACMHAGCDVVGRLFVSPLLPDNNIGPGGAKALAASLQQLDQLTLLSLRGE